MMLTYEDFSIKIEPKRGGSYPVIVLSSPAGEGRSLFTLPFDPADLGQLLTNLGDSVRGIEQAPQRSISETTPQSVGDELFSALFSGPVRSLLDRSMGMIHGQEKGLRIKIHIDPEDPSLAPLASLPWEFIYRKDTRDFLNLSRYTPVLRYLDVQRPYTPLPLEPPLRILVALSEPEGYVGLNLVRERELIERTWAQHQDVEVAFVENATIAVLQDRLVEEKWHVLHFMGHGGFDERSGQGVLVLEDQEGRGRLVDGGTLGILLRDALSLRLVFLNACETARSTKRQGLDPFAGVASALVLTGVPAVVAMQFPITDDAAIRFSQRFYPLLARGYPVDAAAAEGRRAIRLASASSLEWGTPVLFMRAPNGEVFKLSNRRLPQTVQEPDESGTELELLYRAGMEALWRDDWDAAAEKFLEVVGQQPEYRDVQRRLAEVRRQQELAGLYGRARAAEERQDWHAASSALAALLVEAPDYKDASQRRQRAEAALAQAKAATAPEPPAAIRSPAPSIPEPIALAAAAGPRQAAAVAPTGKPRRFRSAILGVLALTAVAVAAGLILFRQSGGGWLSATPTSPAVAVLASTNLTATPTMTEVRVVAPTSMPEAAVGIGSQMANVQAGAGATPTQPPADTPPPEPTVIPTEAPVDTPTPEPPATATPEPTLAPTEAPPAEPIVTAIGASNLRAGPGTDYAVAGQLQGGDSLPITGRNPAGTWWQVTTFDGGQAWVSDSRVTASGPVDQVAVVTQPAPTTQPVQPTPTFAAPVQQTPTPAAAVSARPAGTVSPGMIEDFESLRGWQPGDQRYGEMRRIETSRGNTYSGQISYNFPAVPDNYLVLLAKPPIPIGGQPTRLAAWVYGDASGHFLNVWLQGSDGGIRAYSFGQINHTGWETMTAQLDDSRGWPNGHISGPDGGALDYPASLYALVLDGVPDGAASQGVILVDDIAALD